MLIFFLVNVLCLCVCVCVCLCVCVSEWQQSIIKLLNIALIYRCYGWLLCFENRKFIKSKHYQRHFRHRLFTSKSTKINNSERIENSIIFLYSWSISNFCILILFTNACLWNYYIYISCIVEDCYTLLSYIKLLFRIVSRLLIFRANMNIVFIRISGLYLLYINL